MRKEAIKIEIDAEDTFKYDLYARIGYEIEKYLHHKYNVKISWTTDIKEDFIYIIFDYPCKHIKYDEIVKIAQNTLNTIQAMYKDHFTIK